MTTKSGDTTEQVPRISYSGHGAGTEPYLDRLRPRLHYSVYVSDLAILAADAGTNTQFHRRRRQWNFKQWALTRQGGTSERRDSDSRLTRRPRHLCLLCAERDMPVQDEHPQHEPTAFFAFGRQLEKVKYMLSGNYYYTAREEGLFRQDPDRCSVSASVEDLVRHQQKWLKIA